MIGFSVSLEGNKQLIISGVCRKTSVTEFDVLRQEEEEKDISYIDIRNVSDHIIEISKLYLSESDENLKNLPLGKLKLDAGETYRFRIREEDSLDIKKKGGTWIYLSDESGEVLDILEVPALTRDQEFVKNDDIWEICDIHLEEKEEEIFVPAPVFSVEAGFYENAFDLTIKGEEGTKVYYTLDCSSPNVNSQMYEAPIYVYDRSREKDQYRNLPNLRFDYLEVPFPYSDPMPKCFVVRACAIDANGNTSDVVTKSYFIGNNEINHPLVLSLVSDPKGLFDDEIGICVTGAEFDEWYRNAYEIVQSGGEINRDAHPLCNFQQKGMEWERRSSMELFEESQLLLAEDVGIRVQGNGSRGRYHKRFSIYSREEYNGSYYFPEGLVNDYRQHVILSRDGDLYAIGQMLSKCRNVATLDGRPLLVFLDGELWNQVYLYDKFTVSDMAEKYGLNKDNLVVVKNGETDKRAGEGQVPFQAIWDYLDTHDMTLAESLTEYNQILNIQSYIDSACINSFLQNNDYREKWNNCYFHTIIPENDDFGDSAWHMGILDVDLQWKTADEVSSEVETYRLNPFKTSGRWQLEPITEWPIFKALRENPDFCRRFVLTYMDMINTNLSVAEIHRVLDTLEIEDPDILKFFENRETYIIPYMAEEFELKGTREQVILSSNVEGSPICLNTITPKLQSQEETGNLYSWSGSYYTDYPVCVSTDREDFAYWEVTENGKTERYQVRELEVPIPKGGLEIRAIFQ